MRTIIAAAIFTLILAVFCPALAAQPTQPTLLFLLEGKGTPIGTIHVFSVNSSTGTITEVPGSPFNAGLTPWNLVVDPTRRFVYVANWQSNDITAFSVDASTGALTELPGSPVLIGAQPVTSAVDPTGRFLYVFANNVVNGAIEQFLYEYTIDSATGVLTEAAGSPVQGLNATSITFNPAGNYAYLSQGSTDPQTSIPVVICAVDFSTGALTPVGSFQPAAGSANAATVSPNGNFLYSLDTTLNEADAFTVSSLGGAVAEIPGSPYAAPNFPSSLVVHPSGAFLYVANENEPYQANYTPSQYDGSISAFAIDSATGALNQLPGSPFAAGINPGSIVVDPTGSFAYSIATAHPSGSTAFAQINGFSVDSSSGVLTPLSWSPWTDTANSEGGQLAVSYGPSTTSNPVPMISSLSPPSTTATAVAFTLQVNGADFVPGSTVYFGGQLRSTTYVSSTELNASILASDIDNDGTAVVFVFNPLPGGGASTSVEFPVSALAPVISSINPSTVPAGGNPFELFVAGANFVASSVVNFKGAPLATSYSSPTLILGEIPAADIAAQGTATISVTTPSNGVPGGGTSNTATLTISPPVVPPLSVTSISPTSTMAGGPAFTLTVNGNGFVQGSQVSFNLNNVATTLVSVTQLTASIPATAIAIAGNPYVIVTNPDGSTSAVFTFTVTPGVGSVSPPSLPAGSNALTLNVVGTGFAPGSVVLVNGTPRSTAYVNSASLQATLLSTDLSQGGTLMITVMNPPPGGTSTAISFTVVDYSVTPPTSTPPVTAGQTANFAFTLASADGTFSNPVTFNVSPLPAGAAASFAPAATITPGATAQTVTLSITTTAHTASAPHIPGDGRPVLMLLSLAGMLIALAGLMLRASGGRVPRLVPHLLLALLLIAAAGLAACNGAVGGTSSTTQINPATGTPAGNYPIIVTATSGGVSHRATVTLTVM